MGSPFRWASAAALTLLGAPAIASAQQAAVSASATTTTTTTAAEGEAQAAPPAAEEPKPEPKPEPEPAPVAATTAAPAPAEEKAEEKAEEDAQDDHQRVVGHLGVGLLGATTALTLNPDMSTNTVLLPTIGARYWLSERLGVEAGVGLWHQSGDDNQSSQAAGFDTPTLWAYALHVGVPFVFFHDKHYKFLVQPEANFVASTGRTNDDPNTAGDQGLSSASWGLDLGARAGAEVHFGFIGIPMLSLQGSVGLAYSLRQATVESVQNGRIVESAVTRHTFGTAHYNDPWDLFTSSIAALYYF
ncbi:MAG TPA: hypothetical protein VLC09_08875 [Polyangiaceae bacterium]|nr:hypothetical protein [Polyangiaceae bacterium]